MNRKYTKELLGPIVAKSTTISGVLRFLGLKLAGGTQSHIKKRIQDFELDTSHFTGQAHQKGKPSYRRIHHTKILVLRDKRQCREKSYKLRRALLDYGKAFVCEGCSLGGEWNGASITLEVDHIDNNFLNNVPENLRFLCPNCHSQRPRK